MLTMTTLDAVPHSGMLSAQTVAIIPPFLTILTAACVTPRDKRIVYVLRDRRIFAIVRPRCADDRHRPIRPMTLTSSYIAFRCSKNAYRRLNINGLGRAFLSSDC